MVDITSLDRVKQLLEYESSKTAADGVIRQIITGVSGAVERFLNRHLIEQARTEQYNVDPGQNVVLLRGYPVLGSATLEFRNDINRGFSGSAIDTSNYHVDLEKGIVTFDRLVMSWGPGVLQAIYTGGLAKAAVRLKGTASSVNGTPAASDIVIGRDSGARGILRSPVPGATADIDVLSGFFTAGEIVEKEGTPATNFTLDTITQTPLCMLFPEITQAAEWQIIYNWKRKDTVGLTSVSAEGGSISLESPTAGLQTGVRNMLRRYRRWPGR